MGRWFHIVILQAIPIPAHFLANRFWFSFMRQDAASQVLLDLSLVTALIDLFAVWIGMDYPCVGTLFFVMMACSMSFVDF